MLTTAAQLVWRGAAAITNLATHLLQRQEGLLSILAISIGPIVVGRGRRVSWLTTRRLADHQQHARKALALVDPK